MKSLFASRTFWVNILGLAVTVANVLPPKYAALVLPVANVVLRYLTSTPVSLTGK